MKTWKLQFAVVALLAGTNAFAAQQRVLLEDPAFRTTVVNPVDCERPIEVRLTTRDPALLDADTGDVQRVMDASLAMLRYQCPNLARVSVRGGLQDRSEDSFVAMIDRSDDWRIRTERTFALDLSGAPRYDRSRGRSSRVQAPALAVVGLSAGMNPQTVHNLLASSFDSTPRVLDGGQRMVVEENGCRVDRDWTSRPLTSGARPGWRCLQAWFTPGDNPRLYRVNYEEVVEGNRLEDATRRLIDRYGDPGLREDRMVSQGQMAGSRFSWGEEILIDGERRRELQANIMPSPQMTVVGLNLSDRQSMQSRAFRF